MRKMNMLVVLGTCLLLADNALAMKLRSGNVADDEGAEVSVSGGTAAMNAEEAAALAAISDEGLTVPDILVSHEADLVPDTVTEETTPASMVDPAAPAPVVTPAGWRIVSWFKALSPTNIRAYLAAQWAKVPSRAAFKTWHASMRAKRTFRMMENALGAAVVAVLAYQAWIYAHTQCDADGRVAEMMCNGATGADAVATAASAAFNAAKDAACSHLPDVIC